MYVLLLHLLLPRFRLVIFLFFFFLPFVPFTQVARLLFSLLIYSVNDYILQSSGIKSDITCDVMYFEFFECTYCFLLIFFIDLI